LSQPSVSALVGRLSLALTPPKQMPVFPARRPALFPF